MLATRGHIRHPAMNLQLAAKSKSPPHRLTSQEGRRAGISGLTPPILLGLGLGL